MRNNRDRMAVLLVCAIVAGCASMRRMPEETSERDRELSHGYSLLYNVVSKQAGMDNLFLLKRPPETTRVLIENIADTSGEAKAQLEQLAEDNPEIVLIDQGLPVAEENTRQAVEATTRNRLLLGDAFELRLLLTQVESSNYVAHLARELAELEEDPARAAQLEEIANDFAAINDQVIARLQAMEMPAQTTSTPVE